MPATAKPLLIFDFDGTLANTIGTGIAIFNELAPSYGLRPVTAAEVAELRKLNTRALLDHVGISRLMAVKLGAHIRRLLHERMDSVEMIPGTRDMILGLAAEGFRLGIITSNSADNVRTVLKRFGLLDSFLFIEAGVSLFGKAHRILYVLKKTGIASSKAMYVGDETRDMEAARKSHVSGIAVCWGTNGREAMETEGPDYCIDDPHELIACARSFEKKNF
jgi:phosphoglycolate phosphatase-like HAD superfamily hydrolase